MWFRAYQNRDLTETGTWYKMQRVCIETALGCCDYAAMNAELVYTLTLSVYTEQSEDLIISTSSVQVEGCFEVFVTKTSAACVEQTCK